MGADRDHEYCNPTVGGESSKLLEKMSSLDWKVMVIGGVGDALVDRQIELLKLLEQKGMKVVGHFDDSGHRMEGFRVVLNNCCLVSARVCCRGDGCFCLLACCNIMKASILTISIKKMQWRSAM